MSTYSIKKLVIIEAIKDFQTSQTIQTILHHICLGKIPPCYQRPSSSSSSSSSSACRTFGQVQGGLE